MAQETMDFVPFPASHVHDKILPWKVLKNIYSLKNLALWKICWHYFLQMKDQAEFFARYRAGRMWGSVKKKTYPKQATRQHNGTKKNFDSHNKIEASESDSHTNPQEREIVTVLENIWPCCGAVRENKEES